MEKLQRYPDYFLPKYFCGHFSSRLPTSLERPNEFVLFFFPITPRVESPTCCNITQVMMKHLGSSRTQKMTPRGPR